MSSADAFEWMRNLPSGIGRPKTVRVSPEPMASTVSAAPSHLNTAFGAVRLAEPSASGWSSGKALLPCMVVTTGICASSANVLSSAHASAYSTPWPAQMTGRRAVSRASTASRMSPREGTERIVVDGRYRSAAPCGTSCPITSPCISTSTGPGRPWRAVWKARRIWAPTRSIRSMESASLVTDA